MKVRALIIDDEPHCTEAIGQLCAEASSTIEVVGVAHWMEDARKLMREERPDILFLDIGLKDGCGLDLIADFQTISDSGPNIPVVLFSSGNLSAGEAFDLGIIDYLEKPTTRQRFDLCGERIEAYFRKKRQFVPVDSGEGREFLPVAEIAMIEVTVAGGAWSDCHLVSGRSIKGISTTILDWESMLPEEGFFRVSRSQIVALGQVEGNLLRMANGTGEFVVCGMTCSCSRGRCGAFLEALSKERAEPCR